MFYCGRIRDPPALSVRREPGDKLGAAPQPDVRGAAERVDVRHDVEAQFVRKMRHTCFALGRTLYLQHLPQHSGTKVTLRYEVRGGVF